MANNKQLTPQQIAAKKEKRRRQRENKKAKKQKSNQGGNKRSRGKKIAEAPTAGSHAEASEQFLQVLGTLTAPELVTNPAQFNSSTTGAATSPIKCQHLVQMSSDECGTGFTVALFRRPGINFIVTCKTPALGSDGLPAKWKYAAPSYSPFGGADSMPLLSQNWTIASGQNAKFYPIIHTLWTRVPGTATNYTKHGLDYVGHSSKQYPGQSLIWLDVGETYQVSWSSVTTGIAGNFLRAWIYQNGKQKEAALQSFTTVTSTAGSVSFTAASRGYYSFDFLIVNTGTLTGVNVNFSGAVATTPSISRMFCMNQWCPNINKYSGAAIANATMKLGNKTAELYKGGSMVHANMSKTRSWYDWDDFNSLATVKDRYEDIADEGGWMRLRAQDLTNDLCMRSYSKVSSDGTVLYLYDDIEQDCDYVMQSFNLPSGGNQNFQLTCWTVGEFTTEMDFTTLVQSTIPREIWQAALDASGSFVQFSRNANHLTRIANHALSISKKIVSGGLKAIPKIIHAATTAGKMLEVASLAM